MALDFAFLNIYGFIFDKVLVMFKPKCQKKLGGDNP
jgi:hypothetical protein